MASKKLQRQFKKAYGVADFDLKLDEMIESYKALPELTSEQLSTLAIYIGTKDFFEIVQNSYDQSEKMLGFSSRSLDISSTELNFTNQNLREMNNKVESMLGTLAESLKAAREIQQSLIPPLLQDFGMARIEALYRPSEELSGDFFDIFRKDDWLYFYIADVTSHGVASAQVTYLIKGIFSDIINNSQGTLELETAMSEFCRRYVEFKLRFAAGIQMGRYNMKTGELKLSSSNVPLPIQIRNGASDFLTVDQGPLLDSEIYNLGFKHSSATFQMQIGDVIYFFTDGAVDFPIPDGGREFTERDLARILKNSPEVGWQSLLIDKLIEVNKSEILPDDLTMLKITVKKIGC